MSFFLEPFFSILSGVGLAPRVPAPFPDRLSKLDPNASTLDNDIYNHQTFDWSKSGLELLNPVRVGYFIDKLHRLTSTLTPAERNGRVVTIVDLGCGAGIAIEAIYSAIVANCQYRDGFRATRDAVLDGDLQYRFIGIDMSARSIQIGAARARDKGLSIEYIIGDIYDLPFADDSVDAIICSDVLEHLFDLPAAFASIARVLKPHGIFSFDTINRTPTSYYLTIWILQDLLRAMQGDAHDHRLYVTPDQVHSVMQINGLNPGPKTDLVGMRPGFNFLPLALYKLLAGHGFLMSVLAQFKLTGELQVSYLHWCEKPQP